MLSTYGVKCDCIACVRKLGMKDLKMSYKPSSALSLFDVDLRSMQSSIEAAKKCFEELKKHTELLSLEYYVTLVTLRAALSCIAMYASLPEKQIRTN
jgi:hypothetical protein